MIVRRFDDINMKIVKGEGKGQFLLVPNSVRPDIDFTFVGQAPMGKKPWEGKDLK